MVLPAILHRFIDGAPAAVMTRIAWDRIIDGTPPDQLFEEVAAGRYPRQLTRTHFVPARLDVARGHRPSPRAAVRRRDPAPMASISASYRPLKRRGLAIPAAVVRRTAAPARRLIVAGGGLMPAPVEGQEVRSRDGHVRTGTEPRLAPWRTTGSAGRPGLSLAVDEPARGVILDLIPEEQARCQRRALVDRVDVRPDHLGVMDRDIGVRRLVFRIARRDASFRVRWHRSARPLVPAGRLRARGRCATGQVSEPPIEVSDGEGGVHRLRRLVRELDEPTRDGEPAVARVTNRPAAVPAPQGGEASHGRGRIAGHDQAPTDRWPCEVPGLGSPRAALFASRRSAVAGDAPAVLKGDLRAA